MFTKKTLLVTMLLSVSSLALAMENEVKPTETTVLPQTEVVADITDETPLDSWVFDLFEFPQYITTEEVPTFEKELTAYCLQRYADKQVFAQTLAQWIKKNKIEMQKESELFMAMARESVVSVSALSLVNILLKQNDSQENTKGTQSQQPTPEQKLIDVQPKAEEIKA